MTALQPNDFTDVLDAMRDVSAGKDQWQLADSLVDSQPSGMSAATWILRVRDAAAAHSVPGNYTTATLKNYHSVAKAWPPDTRLSNLGFSAHRAAMGHRTLTPQEIIDQLGLVGLSPTVSNIRKLAKGQLTVQGGNIVQTQQVASQPNWLVALAQDKVRPIKQQALTNYLLQMKERELQEWATWATEIAKFANTRLSKLQTAAAAKANRRSTTTQQPTKQVKTPASSNSDIRGL